MPVLEHQLIEAQRLATTYLIERDDARAEVERLRALVEEIVGGMPEPAAKLWRDRLNAS